MKKELIEFLEAIEATTEWADVTNTAKRLIDKINSIDLDCKDKTPKVGNNEKAKEVCTFSRNCNKKTTDNKCEFTGSCPHKKVPTG